MRSIAAFLALLLALPVAAQTSVSASADRSVAEVGEQVAFTVEVGGPGAENADIDPPSATGLQLMSPTPSMTSLQLLNGRAEMTMQWTYRALRPGAATIGAATVRVAGRTYRTEPIGITVADNGRLAQPAAPQAPARIPTPDRAEGDRAEGDLFVRAAPRITNPYAGQQVVVDYVLYFDPNIDPRSAQFTGSWQAEGVWREELEIPDSAKRPRAVTVDGRLYYALVLRRVAIYPTRSGPIRLGTLGFDLQVLQRSGFDPFGFFPRFSSRYESRSVTAPGVEMTARPLPAGAPADFAGAVGAFSLEANLDRTAAQAGEPLTFTVRVQGTGNVATLPPPPLDVPDTFEQYEPTEDRSVDAYSAPAMGTKVFTYSLLPRAGGRHQVGTTFVYFDPENNRYRTLTGGPFDVTVTGNALAAAPGATGPSAPLEEARWGRAGAPPGRPGAVWLVLAAAVPLAAFGLGLVGRRGPKRPKRKPAPSGRFAQARAALDDPQLFYAALDTALVGDTSAEAAELRAVADRVRYAPGAPPSRAERQEHLARAERLPAPAAVTPAAP